MAHAKSVEKTIAEHGKARPKKHRPCFLKQEKIIQFNLTQARFYINLI